MTPEAISDDAVRAFMAAEVPGILDEHLDLAVKSIDGDKIRAGLAAALPYLLEQDRTEWRIQWFSSNDGGASWRPEGREDFRTASAARIAFGSQEMSKLVIPGVWRAELQRRYAASDWAMVDATKDPMISSACSALPTTKD